MRNSHQLTVEVFGSKFLKKGFRGFFVRSPMNLSNKGPLLDCIARSLARARRYRDYRFALALLDLDGFKLVNESLGHDLGDRLLEEVAKKLRASLRAVDTLVHLGGDKYGIVLENTKDIADARRAILRVQNNLQFPISVGGYEVFCSASIGIALGSPAYREPRDLLRDAATAMHRAHDRGRGSYEVFDPAMHERAVQLLRLETALHRALERNEFRLHYQPIVSIDTRKISGFEALIRWEHPELGLLYPKDFLFAAETTGLIVPISQWVLREAARQIAGWRVQFSHLPHLSVSANFTSKYFARRELIQEISAALSEYGLEASALAFEITESQIMEDPDTVSKILVEMGKLGVQVHIDDFGTGYSSLSYLTRFPVHTLKIDQSFLAGLADDPKNLSVINAIVSLGKSLGLSVIAEGVETEEHLRYLRELNCQFAQGYYFARPMNVESIAGFLKNYS
jgi:diguanylate cyclase (GGDEF)-like protein